MHGGTGWRLRHNHGLNGLRGVAITLVVIKHVRLGPESLGTVGVTVFFTLSGFLITALLLQEHDRAGRVSLSRFWGRRARRLLPALAAFLAVTAAVEWALAGRVPGLWAVLLYIGNWQVVTGHPMGLLLHTWSLAVEEQFYVVWPVVLVGTVRCWGRNGVAWVAGVGAVAAFGWRTWLVVAGASGTRLYYGTDTRADALLVGAALAAVMVGRNWHRVAVWVAPTGVALLVLTALTPGYTVVPVATEVVTAVVIYAAVTAPTTPLSWTPLRWVGERSYGMYLWNFPVAVVADVTPGPRAVVVTASVALTLAFAILSWWLVERPVVTLRFRRPTVVTA